VYLHIPLQHLRFMPMHPGYPHTQPSPNGAIRPELTDALMHAKDGLLEDGNDVGTLVGLAVMDSVGALEGLPVGALERLLVGDDVWPIIVGLGVVGLGVGAAEFAVQRDTPFWLVLHRPEQHLESGAVHGRPEQLHWSIPTDTGVARQMGAIVGVWVGGGVGRGEAPGEAVVAEHSPPTMPIVARGIPPETRVADTRIMVVT